MTTEQLHDIINANATAKAYANAGNDAGAWAAIQEDMPTKVVDKFYTALGIFTAFPSAEAAETCLQKLEAIAEQNPVVKRIVQWLQPGTSGVNFGDVKLRTALDAMVGVLTQEEVDALKSLAEIKETVTVDQVTEAWSRYR